MPGWALRARCPTGFGVKSGTVLTVRLEAGAEATLAQLRSEASVQAKVARDRLRVKAGFPPRELIGAPPGPDEESTTVEAAGLQNRDTVVLERAELGSGTATATSAQPGSAPRREQKKRKATAQGAKSTGVHGLCESSPSATKQKKRRARSAKQWGPGHTLSDGAEPDPDAVLTGAVEGPGAAVAAGAAVAGAAIAGAASAEAEAQVAAEQRKVDFMFMVSDATKSRLGRRFALCIASS